MKAIQALRSLVDLDDADARRKALDLWIGDYIESFGASTALDHEMRAQYVGHADELEADLFERMAATIGPLLLGKPGVLDCDQRPDFNHDATSYFLFGAALRAEPRLAEPVAAAKDPA